jgi:NAD(P)-dependent dehydrogenase (short-subunit alcohol dehydrogenase family)
MTTLCILTGASRGLGAALARALLARDVELLCLSRGRDDALEAAAEAAGKALIQWQVDLVEAAATAERLSRWLQARGPDGLHCIVLINNAAMLESPGHFESQSPDAVTRALRVGLEAPMLLTAAVLGTSERWPLQRRVLNISSGLGRRALAGVATYCAVKAGLDHFSRTLAEEQPGRPNPARVCALAPGIIDTGMQIQLRGADSADFAAQPVFAGFHDSGALDSPEGAAAKVLEILFADDFGRLPVADVRD